jgi:RimJ/RimL family protein N-acetyltransferase
VTATDWRARARLRPFLESDLEAYRAFVNDPVVARGANRLGGAVTAAEHRAWYAALMARNERGESLVRAVESPGGEFAGLVWLHDIDRRHRRAEARIVLGIPGRGFGSAALDRISALGFEAGIEKLWADVLAFNVPALRAFERAGFEREGLLVADRVEASGVRVDVVRLGRRAPGVR